jgi:hypothetical protein
MISAPLLGINLTRRNRRLMVKLAKKFWNIYSSVLKKNNRFSSNALSTPSLNSINNTSLIFNSNLSSQNILTEYGFILADGGKPPPKGFEKYFPGGEKKKTENETKPASNTNTRTEPEKKKFEFELKFGGTKKTGGSNNSSDGERYNLF